MALLGGMDAETYQWKSCGINGCEEMIVMINALHGSGMLLIPTYISMALNLMIQIK